MTDTEEILNNVAVAKKNLITAIENYKDKYEEYSLATLKDSTIIKNKIKDKIARGMPDD